MQRHDAGELAKHVLDLGMPRWPGLIILLLIGVLYLLVPQQYVLGRPWLVLIGVLILGLSIVVTRLWGRHDLTRTLALTAAGLVLLALIVSAGYFVLELPRRDVPPPALLGNAALIWFVNLLTFALLYWEIDAGGPARRRREGHSSSDFVFPQMTTGQVADQHWTPRLIDYVFLAFNTSTAFSPTDTLVLSPRAKLLMMTQSLISLVVAAVLVARAINTL